MADIRALEKMDGALYVEEHDPAAAPASPEEELRARLGDPFVDPAAEAKAREDREDLVRLVLGVGCLVLGGVLLWHWTRAAPAPPAAPAP